MTAEEVARILEANGTAVSSATQARPHAGASRWNTTADDGEPTLVTTVPTGPGRSPEHAAAAVEWLARHGSLLAAPGSAVVDSMRVHWVEPGLRGASDPPAADALTALGQAAASVVGELMRHPAPRFGLHTGGHEYWPQHGTWGAEVLHLAESLAEQALRAGRDVGGQTQRWVERIRSAGEALDQLNDFCLVPRDLGPETLHQSEAGPRLSGLDLACFGDPLLAWVSCILGPPESLQAFLDALGPVATAVLADDAAVERLDAYVSLYQLEQLTRPAEASIPGQLTRVASHEQAVALARSWPGIRERVDAIRQGFDPLSARTIERRVPERALVHRLAQLPLLSPIGLEGWLGAAGGRALGEVVSPAIAWQLAIQLFRFAGAGRVAHAAPASIPATREAILSVAHSSLTRPDAVFHRAVATAWLGLHAIDALDGDVPAAAWTGLLATTRMAAEMDRAQDAVLPGKGQVHAAHVLGHSTIALAAIRSGVAEVGPEDLKALRIRLASAAGTLGTKKQVLLGAREPLGTVVERMASIGLTPPMALVPTVLYATHCAEDDTRELFSPDVFLMLYGVGGTHG